MDADERASVNLNYVYIFDDDAPELHASLCEQWPEKVGPPSGRLCNRALPDSAFRTICPISRSNNFFAFCYCSRFQIPMWLSYSVVHLRTSAGLTFRFSPSELASRMELQGESLLEGRSRCLCSQDFISWGLC